MQKPEQQPLFQLEDYTNPPPSDTSPATQAPKDEIDRDYRAIPHIEGMPVEPRLH